jgi:hypothetical protein
VLQAYFKAYFGEGKDIGNLDLLADIAQGVGLMGKAEVCGWPRFYSDIDVLIPIVSSDHQLLKVY